MKEENEKGGKRRRKRVMFVCHVCHVCVLERKMRKMSVQTHVRVCVRKVEGIFYPCALKFAFLFVSAMINGDYYMTLIWGGALLSDIGMLWYNTRNK